MRNSLFAYLLLLSLPAFAQTAPYQAFEADSAAEPRGGMAFLNTFIQTSLRKPIPAQAAGIGGRTIVEGVVEPDGHISNVKAIQSFRPDCDQEAVRVFSLFNAWKPAQKNGQAVRQRVTIPVTFQSNMPFNYVNGVRTDYFTKDAKPALDDSTQAYYKRVTLIDPNGIPTGDIALYERQNKNWKEGSRLLFFRRRYYKLPDKVQYLVGTQNHQQKLEGDIFVLDETNALISQAYYENGDRVGSELIYHANGAIAEKNNEIDKEPTITIWYTNGQVKELKKMDKPETYGQNRSEQLIAFWDSTGYQQVNNGSGQATHQSQVVSNADTTRHTTFIEKGQYTNGFKHGTWTGRYADGSYFYEEIYDKGALRTGKARLPGVDTVRYTTVMQQAEFRGGIPELQKFLSQNLTYPPTAQKAGAQGRVFVSFVVCTDGALCDYELLKGVHPDLNQEAMRVVKKMNGKWKPGFQRGQKVRVKYNLPINFTLN